MSSITKLDAIRSSQELAHKIHVQGQHAMEMDYLIKELEKNKQMFIERMRKLRKEHEFFIDIVVNEEYSKR